MKEESRPLPPFSVRHSKRKDAKKVYSGSRHEIFEWPQQLFDGTTVNFEVVKRQDTAILLPVIGDEVVIVTEEQPHWGRQGTTLVAGAIHDDERIEDGARRELLEETGMSFDHFHLVHVEQVVPAIEWFAYTFIATGYTGTQEKHLDPGERNEVLRISVDKLIEIARSKKFFYRPKFIEDFLIADDEEGLRNALRNPASYALPQ